VTEGLLLCWLGLLVYWDSRAYETQLSLDWNSAGVALVMRLALRPDHPL